jgi:hypothetical protein
MAALVAANPDTNQARLWARRVRAAADVCAPTCVGVVKVDAFIGGRAAAGHAGDDDQRCGTDGHANEDLTGAVPTAVVLIDGAGIPGTESICRHGAAWYASRLGGSLLSLLSMRRDRSPSALLAEAIEQVTDDHRDTCDVADPISPSATVAILRRSDGVVEHLVLGDSVLVLDRAHGAPLVVTDPRRRSSAGRTGPRSKPPPRAATSTTESSEICVPTGTSRAASGWPTTTRERPTRRSPEGVRSPS